MHFTILLPHYKTPKITAYAVYKLLQNKGKHEVDIIVIDNNSGDGTIDSLWSFKDEITILSYPKDKIQSHGIAFDWAMPYVKSEHFITVESDSFPYLDTWLDYYEELIEKGFDSAGSLLALAGGQFIHPCGAMYKKSLWQEAMNYAKSIEYSYYPGMWSEDGFDYHLMVNNVILDRFIDNPEKYIPLSGSYKPFSVERLNDKKNNYSPMCGVFHNGMGCTQESIYTYMNRNVKDYAKDVLLDNNYNFVMRVGYEPGQWFCYWQVANDKKVFGIPTETLWMPNRINQQQERTIMANGFVHLWGISSYKNSTDPKMMDVIKYKQKIEDELYDEIPEKFKTPLIKEVLNSG